MNLISKYLTFRKTRLITYGLLIIDNPKYSSFIKDSFKEYINNYIELIYHKKLETLDKVNKITLDIIQKEQEGKRLEQLDTLASRELLETNEGYLDKKKLINLIAEVMLDLISFDQKDLTEENIENEINDFLTRVSKKVDIKENTHKKLLREWKKTEKTLEKVLQKEKNFNLSMKEYEENIHEVKLTKNMKQLNIYKKNLVTRVEQEEKIAIEKIKLSLMLLNEEILTKVINKEEIGAYIIYIEDELWKKRDYVDCISSLIDDDILKAHIHLGIHYNLYMSSKTIQKLKQLNYQFACYQDFSRINDLGTKLDTLDSSNIFTYLIITGYKEKDYKDLEKQEPTNIKKILFSKEG